MAASDSSEPPDLRPRFAGPAPESRLYLGTQFSSLRLEIDAAEFFINMAIMILPMRSLGVLMRLVPHACHRGILFDAGFYKCLGRMCGVSDWVARSIWPDIEPFFFVDGGRLFLREQPWLTVSFNSGARVPLRHLFDDLIAYWGEACVYCGADDVSLHIEHVIPKARGGRDTITNLTLACASCNAKKGTKTAAEFGFPSIHERAERIQ